MFLKYSIFFSLAFFSLRPINTPNTPLAIKNSAIHISSGIFMLYSIMEWCGNQPRKFLFGRETEYIQSRFQGIRGDSGGIGVILSGSVRPMSGRARPDLQPLSSPADRFCLANATTSQKPRADEMLNAGFYSSSWASRPSIHSQAQPSLPI